MMSDPYKTLGVSRNASDEEIKKAYRVLSRKYHPDANINNPNAAQAEERFKEVQQAYDMIMKEREQGTGGYGYESAYGGFGGFGGRNASQDEYTMHMNAAANYINSRHFQEALHVLEGITDRTALWYYYSAVANSGIGNNVVALQHAKKAESMEPGNQRYRSLAAMLESGGDWYQSMRGSYGGYRTGGEGFCLKLCIANLLCNACCGGGGVCCGMPMGGMYYGGRPM